MPADLGISELSGDARVEGRDPQRGPSPDLEQGHDRCVLQVQRSAPCWPRRQLHHLPPGCLSLYFFFFFCRFFFVFLGGVVCVLLRSCFCAVLFLRCSCVRAAACPGLIGALAVRFRTCCRSWRRRSLRRRRRRKETRSSGNGRQRARAIPWAAGCLTRYRQVLPCERATPLLRCCCCAATTTLVRRYCLTAP